MRKVFSHATATRRPQSILTVTAAAMIFTIRISASLPEYEDREEIQELMELILAHVYEDFHVRSVIMKAQEDAWIRRSVLKGLYFVPAQDECSIPFKDYFIRY